MYLPLKTIRQEHPAWCGHPKDKKFKFCYSASRGMCRAPQRCYRCEYYIGKKEDDIWK
jgi:hypothetical protein